MIRPLIVAAHGTASAAGRRVVQGCASAAARRLSVPVQVGYVDVCEPALESVVRPGSVVVPLFLASGYHVRHDVPAAVARTPGVSVTPALGVAAGVVEALAGRLGEAVDATSGVRPDAIVLASAGSTRAKARAEVAELATLLGERIAAPVSVAYLSGPGPSVADVCADHRARGRRRLAVATHLLAPGVFLDRTRDLAGRNGVVAVADALGTHPAISALVAGRYAAAVEAAA